MRAHTPMSNLFSCLWFNEVDRFTPRDQLSFAYTYHKLRTTNPEKPFYLNMFKVCILCVTLDSEYSLNLRCTFSGDVLVTEPELSLPGL